MSDNIPKTLLALKDVHGIQGSFVLNAEGALLAMEMPALFEPSMFVELGPRIERLAETFAALGDEMESCLVRFSDHLFCVKQFAKGGSLCVLTESSVNLPALKMAINLAHRRLVTEVATAEPLSATPAPAVVAEPAAASMNGHAAEPEPTVVANAAAPPPEHHSPRYYRGHLVED